MPSPLRSADVIAIGLPLIAMLSTPPRSRISKHTSFTFGIAASMLNFTTAFEVRSTFPLPNTAGIGDETTSTYSTLGESSKSTSPSPSLSARGPRMSTLTSTPASVNSTSPWTIGGADQYAPGSSSYVTIKSHKLSQGTGFWSGYTQLPSSKVAIGSKFRAFGSVQP